jgi:hypothetical protein
VTSLTLGTFPGGHIRCFANHHSVQTQLSQIIDLNSQLSPDQSQSTKATRKPTIITKTATHTSQPNQIPPLQRIKPLPIAAPFGALHAISPPQHHPQHHPQKEQPTHNPTAYAPKPLPTKTPVSTLLHLHSTLSPISHPNPPPQNKVKEIKKRNQKITYTHPSPSPPSDPPCQHPSHTALSPLPATPVLIYFRSGVGIWL